MTKVERWLTTFAIIFGLLPLILIAVFLKILPTKIPIIDITSDEPYMSKYNNLFAGFFCLVPLLIVGIALYIKSRVSVYKNYMAIMIVSMIISATFTGIIIYSLVLQAKSTDILEKVDILGLICVILSLSTAVVSQLFRYKKRTSRVAIKNKYTKANPAVFRIVHRTASNVFMVGFAFLAIGIAFLRGWIALCVYLVSLVGAIVWVQYYSYYIHKKFQRSQRTTKD